MSARAPPLRCDAQEDERSSCTLPPAQHTKDMYDIHARTDEHAQLSYLALRIPRVSARHLPLRRRERRRKPPPLQHNSKNNVTHGHPHILDIQALTRTPSPTKIHIALLLARILRFRRRQPHGIRGARQSTRMHMETTTRHECTETSVARRQRC
jgi:hypothetical protein